MRTPLHRACTGCHEDVVQVNNTSIAILDQPRNAEMLSVAGLLQGIATSYRGRQDKNPVLPRLRRENTEYFVWVNKKKGHCSIRL